MGCLIDRIDATLEARLENWARAQHSGTASYGGAVSAECYYRTPGYRELMPQPIPVDQRDAELVNDAWKRLMPLDRDVLTMHYVSRANFMSILRQMKLIRVRPQLMDAHVRRWDARVHRWTARRHVRLPAYEPDYGQIWDFALWHAQHALAQNLAKIEREFVSRKNPVYTARRLPISAIAR